MSMLMVGGDVHGVYDTRCMALYLDWSSHGSAQDLQADLAFNRACTMLERRKPGSMVDFANPHHDLHLKEVAIATVERWNKALLVSPTSYDTMPPS